MTLLCRQWLASFFTLIPLSIILPSHYCWWYSVFMIVTYGEANMNFSYYIAVGPSNFLLCFSLPVSHISHPMHSFLSYLPASYSSSSLCILPSIPTEGIEYSLTLSSRWKKEFVLTHSSRVQIILIQESRHQELKAVGHIISTIKSQQWIPVLSPLSLFYMDQHPTNRMALPAVGGSSHLN